MSIEFNCECGTVGRIPDAALHQQVKCPKCKRMSYIGSRTGPAVPVVHRPDKPRGRRRRKLLRGAVLTSFLVIGGFIVWGLVKNDNRTVEIHEQPVVDRSAETESPEEKRRRGARLRIQKILRRKPELIRSYERLRATLVAEYQQLAEIRETLRIAHPTGLEAVTIRRIHARERELHRDYIEWAGGVDAYVLSAFKGAINGDVRDCVAEMFPEPSPTRDSE